MAKGKYETREVRKEASRRECSGESRIVQLKVEPSFEFKPGEEEDERGFCRIERQNIGHGLDISLYQDGKLCLSPHDFYYTDKEEHVKRDLSRQTAMAHYRRVLLDILRKFPNLEAGFYIFYSNLRNRTNEEIRGQHLRLIEHTDSRNINDLVVVGRDNLERLFDNYWAREYPENVWADKYEGNDFILYLMKPENIRAYIEFSRRLIHDEDGAKKEIEKLSSLKIGNLSYGYRARVFKTPESLRVEELI